MTVNTETAIRWMESKKGRVTYSMDYRNGPNSYDCSSAVYYALRSAGASAASWACNTETLHGWLIANGYVLFAENKDWDMQRGDVIIWGPKGQSLGAVGHALMALDADNVIHCTYAVNGITTNNYNQLYGWQGGAMGGPYVYVYRQKGTTATKSASTQTTTPAVKIGTLERLAGEVMAGQHGSGTTRQKALGAKYEAVQTIINERLKVITASTSHQRLAKQVLAGKLGNGQERKDNLGSYYNAVQAIINKG